MTGADGGGGRAETGGAMATLTFLGTAAALPAADRSNAMLAVFGPDQPGLLIDCGAGIVQALLRAHIGPDAISDILITHAHIDHCGDFPSLIEAWRISGRTAPVRVHGLPEVLAVIQQLLDIFSFELTLDAWPFTIALLPTDEGPVQLGPFAARVLRMDHAVPSLGVRLELPGGPLAYTCDTQPNPNILPLAQGAQTLITECTFLDDEVTMARLSKHLTAREVGEIAQESGAARLAIVHLGVGEAPNFLARVRDEITRTYTGELIIPCDGDSMKV